MGSIASISAFVQVVQRGSFKGAARHLDIAPAMVSNHVRTLEHQLGVRLLNRTTRKVALTEVGAGYFERCVRILSELAEAESFVRSQQSKPAGSFRLNTSVALARILSPLIAEYVLTFPEVSFELIMTDDMVDMIEQRFDLAVRAGELPNASSLIRRSLGIGKLVLCAAPSYLARAGVPRHPRDLADHNCLAFACPAAGDQWRFAGPDGEHAVEAAGNLRSNSIEALRAATAAGQGLCLLPLLIVADDLMQKRLVPLLPDYTTADALIHAAYPAGRHMPAKVRTFLDFLVRRLRGAGPHRATENERPPHAEPTIIPPRRAPTRRTTGVSTTLDHHAGVSERARI